MRCGAFHRVEGTLCLVRHGQAALSGSKTKAPGFAGGYLPSLGDAAARVVVDPFARTGTTAGSRLLNTHGHTPGHHSR
jgi:hypothetical protein